MPQIIGERNVTGTDFSFPVDDHGTYGKVVILYELFADGEHIKFLDIAGCPSDVPAHQHVEFQIPPFACPDEMAYIQRFEKGEHGHGCIHPHLECIGAGRFFWIYFFHVSCLFHSNWCKSKVIVSKRIE